MLFSLFTAGIFASALAYIRHDMDDAQGCRLWTVSIILSVIGLCLFALGTATTEEAIKSNSVIFTFANTFYLASIFFQTLFCRALVKTVSNRLLFLTLIMIVLLGAYYEYLRGAGEFIGRVVEVGAIVSILHIVQIFHLINVLKTVSSAQIKFLLAFTLIDLAIVVLRLWVAMNHVDPVLTLDSIPISLLAVISFNLLLTALSYLTMVGFWAERSVASQKVLELESKRNADLLDERESLIRSLVTVNRSAAVGALSASVVHELSQPVAALKIDFSTIQNLLSQKNIEVEQIRALLKKMQADNVRTEQIIQTVRNVLAKENHHLGSTSLRKVLDNTVMLARTAFGVSGIKVHMDIQDATVVGDQIQMQQVFLNLLNNSVQALNANGDQKQSKDIWLSSLKGEGANKMRVTVEDNGPGVPPYKVSGLFNLFETNKKDGLGVGLWLSQEIMLSAGGRISYQPRAGGGASFWVDIPIKRDT